MIYLISKKKGRRRNRRLFTVCKLLLQNRSVKADIRETLSKTGKQQLDSFDFFGF